MKILLIILASILNIQAKQGNIEEGFGNNILSIMQPNHHEERLKLPEGWSQPDANGDVWGYVPLPNGTKQRVLMATIETSGHSSGGMKMHREEKKNDQTTVFVEYKGLYGERSVDFKRSPASLEKLAEDRQEIVNLLIRAFTQQNKTIVDDFVRLRFPILGSTFQEAVGQFISTIGANVIQNGLELRPDHQNAQRWQQKHGAPVHLFVQMIDLMNRDLFPLLSMYVTPTFGEGFDGVNALTLLTRQKDFDWVVADWHNNGPTKLSGQTIKDLEWCADHNRIAARVIGFLELKKLVEQQKDFDWAVADWHNNGPTKLSGQTIKDLEWRAADNKNQTEAIRKLLNSF